MGIAIKEVSRLPHFVNLNEDPSLSESLIYYLKEGNFSEKNFYYII